MLMSPLNVLLSLITESNDYQQEQAHTAAAAAQRLGIKLQAIYADGDAIVQSQQLLQAIQSKTSRPDAIVFEPAGTGLAVVAKAAAAAGIGWVVMNRDVDYLPELRNTGTAPCFSIGTDHLEVGRIQGRQIGALLPGGGNVLHIQGPIGHHATQQRNQGTEQTKPTSVNLRTIKGHWTEASGYEAVSAWLRLSTSHHSEIAAVVAQNDDMAIGARRAFQENTSGEERQRWLNLPFLGCDGLTKSGQVFLTKGLLQATVRTPPITDRALEMFTQAFKSGKQPPERTLISPVSLPPLEVLAKGLPSQTVVS